MNISNLTDTPRAKHASTCIRLAVGENGGGFFPNSRQVCETASGAGQILDGGKMFQNFERQCAHCPLSRAASPAPQRAVPHALQIARMVRERTP